MDAARVRLSAAEAHELAIQVLRRVGYAEENARIVSDHLLDAALCGYEYSGLPKILEIVEAARASQPRAPITVARETEMSMLIDGGNHVGMITMHHATDLAIRKALENGFAAVGVANSWMSGRSAYYVERVARAGLIGIHTVSSADLVAPPGAARASMGTNPIAFGFPGQDDPLVIDMGTSAIMGTEVGLIRRRGDLLPEGVAIDRDGAPTRDPEAVREGAFLHLAGYKGFALALAMKALGVFAGSGLSPGKDYGYLMLAIKPDLLVPLEAFKAELQDMLAKVRATPRQPGVQEIRIPSERSFREREINRKAGIEIDAAIHRSLLALGA